MITTVTTVNKGSYDVYCGRGSIFGNPFYIGTLREGGDGIRAEVVFKHLVYFHKRLISDPQFKRRVLALRGKKLGCYCHDWDGIGPNPLYCHCDTVADYLNSLPD